MKLTFRHTRYACYAGITAHSVVNNLAPIFFIIFSDSFSVSYRELGFLVMLNFFIQLLVDAACIKAAAPIGYRKLLVISQAFAAAGLVLLGVMPLVMQPAFAGLVIAVIVYAFGGGLLEVLISPVVDAIPGEAEMKPAAMSFLHSFYCWGQMLVILITTFALSRIGLENWYVLPFFWAALPFANMFLFMKVPMVEALPNSQTMGLRKMAAQPAFLLCLVLMLCAGASEQAVAQWASIFAERALAMPKVLGDVFGPALFALFMGSGRMLYGILGAKIKIVPYMCFSAALCVLCYAGISVVPNPLVQLAACAITGFAVSVMWPAVFSLSSARFPLGGTALFAVLALTGDMGCSVGPWIVGFVSGAAEGRGITRTLAEVFSFTPLEAGIAVCVLFPLFFFVSVLLFNRMKVKAEN